MPYARGMGFRHARNTVRVISTKIYKKASPGGHWTLVMSAAVVASNAESCSRRILHHQTIQYVVGNFSIFIYSIFQHCLANEPGFLQNPHRGRIPAEYTGF